jgi:1-deoxy-D-xylulose-5-phosphate reductoisomerase
MAWPERISSGVDPLNLFDIGRLEFEPPDDQRFPCLRLAAEAMRAGGTATAVLNAANEVAVAEFLAGHLRFTGIPRVVEATLANVQGRPADSLEVILAADREARDAAGEAVRRLAA